MRKLPEGSAKAAMLRPTIEREEPVMGKLQDKTALITGASSGIGKKVAISFAEEGADIAINYPDASQAKNAEAVVAEIEKRGRRAIAIKADVSKADENAAMVDSFMEAFSHIDILVNNAGVGRTVTVDEMTVENWDEMIAINLRSVFLTTHKVLPLMYARGHGKIINTASQLAYKGAPGLAHYTASKAAIISFTRSLSLEIADRGVNVNCVAPAQRQHRFLMAWTKTYSKLSARLSRVGASLWSVRLHRPTYFLLQEMAIIMWANASAPTAVIYSCRLAIDGMERAVNSYRCCLKSICRTLGQLHALGPFRRRIRQPCPRSWSVFHRP